jgi:YbbR domain-containing protein
VTFPGFITRNWKLKVGCTLIALVTWVGVVYAVNPPETRLVSVPVPQSSIPTQFVLVHPVQNVAVRVGGDQNTLQSLNADAITVTVAWSDVTHAGAYSIPISVVSDDPNIELIDRPTTVRVDVDAFTSKSVPVTIVSTNPPPVGYRIGAEHWSPSSVVIDGPERELAGIQAHVTVNLIAQKANFQADVSVLAYDSKGVRLNDVHPNPGTVSVSIAITADVTTRLVAVLPPRPEGTASPGHYLVGIVVSPSAVDITGPQDLLNGIDSVATTPIVLNGVFGNFTETLSLVLPAGVTASVSKVTVTIEIGTIPSPPTPTPTPTPSPTPGPT